MSPDYASLRGITAREIISALLRDGFSLQRSAGAHRLYRHPDGRRVTVSFHTPGVTLGGRVLRSMLELQARWTRTDLQRLGSMK